MTEIKSLYDIGFEHGYAKAKSVEAEPNSCEYWDSESHFCALRRPQAEPKACTDCGIYWEHIYKSEPRKQGRWIPWNDSRKTFECSNCRAVYACTEPTEITEGFQYCPNCGAKMDEVENG